MKVSSLRTALLIAVAATALTGCDTLRNAAGMDKSAPDEFAVTTKAPLVIPPDYNLQPPRPGAVPTNQVDPTDSAENALFGTDPAQIAAQLPSTFSETEKMVLANAKVQSIDPQIHQHLAEDYKNTVAADDGFTKDILFWQKPKTDQGQPLDADQEAKRIGDKNGTAPAAEAKPAPAPKKDDGGWFDGWFDWF